MLRRPPLFPLAYCEILRIRYGAYYRAAESGKCEGTNCSRITRNCCPDNIAVYAEQTAEQSFLNRFENISSDEFYLSIAISTFAYVSYLYVLIRINFASRPYVYTYIE